MTRTAAARARRTRAAPAALRVAPAGLPGGDALVRFDDITIDHPYDRTYALRSRRPGRQVRNTVLRGGRETEIHATPGRKP